MDMSGHFFVKIRLDRFWENRGKQKTDKEGRQEEAKERMLTSCKWLLRVDRRLARGGALATREIDQISNG